MSATIHNPPRLVLASRSPRRRQLLTEAGFAYTMSERSIDDGGLLSGPVNPEQWVMALAYLKAVGGADAGLANSVVLGADTICIGPEGQLIGQPRDAAHAEEILRSFVGVPHSVVTGVAIVDPATNRREMFSDGASVTWGHVSDAQIGEYIATGQWQGKAGAYNLRERLDAGWPIEFTGDPTSIMGLPMAQLADRLPAWGIVPGVAA
ncbi:MAG: Maf family protein [Phycisphaerales bacterium JB061]